MLQVDVRSDIADPIKRVGFQNAVAEGVSPDPADDGENVVHCFRGQPLLQQLRLK